MQAFHAIALSFALLATTSLAQGWEPPKNPDPDLIVNEALADGAQGRFADAARKHVWYHENAVRLKPVHAQVRLTVVLEEWVALARKYPPAMEDLLRTRDRAINRLQSQDDNLSDAFVEVVRINEMLGDAETTRRVFSEIGQRDETIAARFWLIALPALAATQDHRAAYRYLQVDKVLQALEAQYAAALTQMGISDEHRAQFRTQAVRYLDLTLARVIWVLLSSGREELAHDVARRGRQMLASSGETPLIDAALRNEALPLSTS